MSSTQRPSPNSQQVALSLQAALSWPHTHAECISDWDKYFEEGDDWFNEEDTDMKDILREQVLEYVERLLEEEKTETSS